MFCPKCGTNAEEGDKICTSCGLEFDFLKQTDEQRNNVEKNVGNELQIESYIKTDLKNKSNSIIKYIYFGLGAVVLVMFFMSASTVAKGGSEIMRIQSVGGKTLEEAYYSQLGTIYSGYAMTMRAIGISFASLLIWLGLRE